MTDYSKANISTLSKMFGFDRGTVTSKIEKSVLKPADKVKGFNVYQVSEVACLLFSTGGINSEGIVDVETMKPSEQRDYWHAKQKELDYLATQRTYIPQSDARSEFASLASRIKETIQSFPDKAETEMAATPKEVERLISLCDFLQKQIYSDYLD